MEEFVEIGKALKITDNNEVINNDGLSSVKIFTDDIMTINLVSHQQSIFYYIEHKFDIVSHHLVFRGSNVGAISKIYIIFCTLYSFI